SGRARGFPPRLRVSLAHVGETGTKRFIVRARQRILAEQIDVVGNQHKLSGSEGRIYPTRRIRQDNRIHTHRAQDTHSVYRLPGGVALVEVCAARERGYRHAVDMSDNELSGVAGRRRWGPVGNLAVRDRDGTLERIRECPQTAAKYDRDSRILRDLRLNEVRRVVHRIRLRSAYRRYRRT